TLVGLSSTVCRRSVSIGVPVRPGPFFFARQCIFLVPGDAPAGATSKRMPTLHAVGVSVVTRIVMWLGKKFVRTALALSVVALGASSAVAQVGLPGSNPQRSTRQTNPGASDIDEPTKNLRDDDAAVRLEAVKALAASQDKKAVEHLIEATADLDPRVKIKAIDALGTLRAADATPV